MSKQNRNARAALDLLCRELGLSAGRGPCVADLWEEFAAVKSLELLSSWGTERGRATRHLLPFFAHLRAAGLTLIDVDRYRAKRRVEKIERGDTRTTAGTRNREVTLLQRILNFGVARGLLPSNPIAHSRQEKERGARLGRISGEGQFQRLLAETVDPITRTLAILSYDHGPRPKEAASLRWDWIDADGWVTVPYAKNGRPRRYRLTGRCRKAVFALPRICHHVFANPDTKRRYNPRTLYKYMKRAIVAAGLVGPDGAPLVPYALRHSFAYVARRLRKIPEKTIMKMAGWRTRSAFDRYGSVDEEETEEGWAAMDAGVRAELRAMKRKGPRRDSSHTSRKIVAAR